jgi:hypothetical protein
MRNALFYVAKDTTAVDKDKVLGVAMWLPAKPAQKETWTEWIESWRLWAAQVGMNLRYGRGGLNVKVGLVIFLYLRFKPRVWTYGSESLRKKIWLYCCRTLTLCKALLHLETKTSGSSI